MLFSSSPRRVSSALIQNRTQLLRGGASAGPKREPKKREEEGEEKKPVRCLPLASDVLAGIPEEDGGKTENLTVSYQNKCEVCYRFATSF